MPAWSWCQPANDLGRVGQGLGHAGQGLPVEQPGVHTHAPESQMCFRAGNGIDGGGDGVADVRRQPVVPGLGQVSVEFGVLVLVQVQLARAGRAGLGGRRGALGRLQRVVGQGRDREVVLADQRAVGVGEVRLGQLAAVRGEVGRHGGLVRGQVEQPQVVGVALEGGGPRFQQPVGVFLGVLPLQVAHVLGHLLQRDLVSLPQQRQLLGVALLQGAQQLAAERAHLAGDLQRLLDQQQRADRAERLVQAADDAADVDAGRGRRREHAGVERRVEQRELLHHALDVLAVADLEQPVGDGVPVAEQVLVLRDAEVQRAPDAEQRAALVARVASAGRRGGHEVERELGLQADQRVGHAVQARLLELPEVLRAGAPWPAA